MARKAVLGTAVCAFVGLACLVVGLVLIPVFKKMINNKIKEKIPLKNGTDTFQDWVVPPAPIYFQVWVFDIVNQEEVIQGARPVLEEKGPYTYREHREKVDIMFHENSTAVSYKENRWFIFERSKSVGNESDTFTTVNIPMVTVANIIRYEFPMVRKLVDFILDVTGEHLFKSLSIADILWGYEDSLLKDFNKLLKDLHISFHIDDHFGLFYKHNGSNDGIYDIFTGTGNLSKFANIKSWNNNSTLSFWTSPEANMLNGTDGTIYPPFVDKSKTLYLFSSDVCRSLYIDFTEETRFKDIQLYKFVVPDSLFENASVNHFNKGFCTPPGNCLPSGVLNVSTCRQGAPVILSQPHFLGADPKILHGVEGIRPNRVDHQTFIEIEPKIGVAMNVAKKLQINIFVEKVKYIKDTEKINPVYIPVLWLNESAAIDDKDADKFKKDVEQPIKITEAVQYGLIAFGGFILVCTLAFVVKILLTKKKYSELESVDDRRVDSVN